MRNIAAEYSAFEFFEKRTEIGEVFRASIEEIMKEYYIKIT